MIVAPDMRDGGSVGVVAWRHAIELSRSHKVYVITRAIPAGGHDNVSAMIVQPRAWNWLRRFCHVPNEMSFLRSARQALTTLCGRERVDLVWCHSHGTAALVAARLRQRFGFQVVMTGHGDIFDRPPGAYSRELTWFYKQVTPRAYRQSDFVQVLSPYMAALAVRGGAHPSRVRVIPNGIDPQEIGAGALAPRSPDSFVPEGTLRLLYVGSLWNLKGVDVLLRAVAHLKAACAGAPGAAAQSVFRQIKLTVIGDGKLRRQLEAMVATLGLVDQVHFLGRVPRGYLARHYQHADILCVPSISEALSTVTLEGMYCGLPVAGSDTGGIPFLVERGVNGYLATPGDERSLAAAITTAASSGAHLAELGKQGFRKARQSLGWPDIAKQLNGLANDALMCANGRGKGV